MTCVHTTMHDTLDNPSHASLTSSSSHLMCLCSKPRMYIHRHGEHLFQRCHRLQQQHHDTTTFHRLDRAGEEVGSDGFKILEVRCNMT